MTTEHFDKYQQLASLLGWDALRALVPFDTHTIRCMLMADEHLSSQGNAPWDGASMGPKSAATCDHCKQEIVLNEAGVNWPSAGLQRTAKDRSLPWHKAPYLSLSQRNCVLKHVARVDALAGRADR